MSSKVFLCDGASLLESEIMEIEPTESLKSATYFVNPYIQSLLGKTLIVNLISEINYEKLHRFNNFIVRFPIKELDNLNASYQLIKYEVGDQVEVTDESEISCLILNKFLLNNIDNIDKVKDKKFLLGVDYFVGDDLNLIGYSILKYDYKQISNDLDEIN